MKVHSNFWQTRASGPYSCCLQPLHGLDFSCHLHQDVFLRRRWDPGHPMVLAEVQYPITMTVILPSRTRPSGQAFFWSYAYYLSHFLHMFRTYFTILGHRKLGLLNIFKNLMLLCMLFMWLEFSQWFQLVEIMLATLVYYVIYGYKFWTTIGLPSTCFPFVLSCQIVLLGSTVLCHVGALLLHLRKGGYNGIGAWIFNKTSLKELLDIWQKHI